MSDAVSVLNGAAFDGFAQVSDTGPRGMITLRGAPEVLAKMAKVLGLAVPDTLGLTSKGDLSLAWMSPDEAMVLCDYADAPGLAEKVQGAVKGDHALVAVVSDARAVFRVKGDKADQVLRKLTPAPLDGFAPGQVRRTRLAQVAGAFWMTDAQTFEIMCFRSQAQYVFDLLSKAARPGSELDL
jgi:sarcosine oxidase subunit gamma